MANMVTLRGALAAAEPTAGVQGQPSGCFPLRTFTSFGQQVPTCTAACRSEWRGTRGEAAVAAAGHSATSAALPRGCRQLPL